MGGKFRPYLILSEYFFKKGTIDSSLYYAIKANQAALLPVEFQNTSEMLAKLYKTSDNSDSALKYYESSLALNDSINNADKRRKLQSQDFDEQIQQQEIEATRIELENRIKVYILLSGLSILIVTAVVLLRNNVQRKKTNIVLKQKNNQIEKTLSDLKSTQAQLIQSEKMASLGELTAGIAHEIQNPLNFVNNFSEVNKEMIAEMKEEIDKGNYDEVKLIANDLVDNEEKINHHGKRADAIVKGMLEHSKTSTGKKEPTDINKLADEYFRLSYHGFRAKDKSFNTEIKTDFDESIGKINIVPQDIGRVLLNLFNNAFYAVAEKMKTADENYKPTISVQTKKINEKIEITVTDNGNGIPQNIIDKIFQPFFTTKPTGQGTGLGLSLAYDIITKEHKGTIKVERKVDEGNPDNFGKGEGSAFVIQLPTK